MLFTKESPGKYRPVSLMSVVGKDIFGIGFTHIWKRVGSLGTVHFSLSQAGHDSKLDLVFWESHYSNWWRWISVRILIKFLTVGWSRRLKCMESTATWSFEFWTGLLIEYTRLWLSVVLLWLEVCDQQSFTGICAGISVFVIYRYQRLEDKHRRVG